MDVVIVTRVCFRVLEKVNFESKFDLLPEFQPEKADGSSVPPSPSMLLAGLRKRKIEGGLDSPASSLHPNSALPSSR